MLSYIFVGNLSPSAHVPTLVDLLPRFPILSCEIQILSYPNWAYLRVGIQSLFVPLDPAGGPQQGRKG